MKCPPFIIIFALVAGCTTDDVRLHGTWQSNREATVAAAFRENQSLTNLPPERLERFKDMFGHLTMTYSNGLITETFRDKNEVLFHYRVVAKGSDFVVIRTDAPLSKNENIRLRFVDGGRAYWVNAAVNIDERFDKVE